MKTTYLRMIIRIVVAMATVLAMFCYIGPFFLMKSGGVTISIVEISSKDKDNGQFWLRFKAEYVGGYDIVIYSKKENEVQVRAALLGHRRNRFPYRKTRSGLTHGIVVENSENLRFFVKAGDRFFLPTDSQLLLCQHGENQGNIHSTVSLIIKVSDSTSEPSCFDIVSDVH